MARDAHLGAPHDHQVAHNCHFFPNCSLTWEHSSGLHTGTLQTLALADSAVPGYIPNSPKLQAYQDPYTLLSGPLVWTCLVETAPLLLSVPPSLLHVDRALGAGVHHEQGPVSVQGKS